MALTLGAFLGKDVAGVRLSALKAPTTRPFEALGSATKTLYFRHVRFSLSLMVPARMPCGRKPIGVIRNNNC